MALDGEMRRKIAVSVASVVFFIALILGIGSVYSNGHLQPAGGLALVGAIAAFILVMGAVGLWLARS